MKQFNTYNEARQHAQELASLVKADVGIEKGTAWDRGKFNVIMLPSEQHRSGHELRCEVVRFRELAIAATQQ